MRVVFAVALLVACGGSPAPGPQNTEASTPPPAAAAAPEEPPTEVQRSDRQAVELALKIVGDMAEAAATASGSCEQMGQSLSSLAIANSDLFARLNAIAGDPRRSTVLDELREGMENAMTELFTRVGDCSADPGVRQAMEAMGG